jgi:hypothetical protein
MICDSSCNTIGLEDILEKIYNTGTTGEIIFSNRVGSVFNKKEFL